MEPLASPEWREQLLGYLEQACHNPSSNLYQLAQELSNRIDDQQGREQHVKQVLEDTQTTFKTRLKAGAYDQLHLDKVDAQLLDTLRSRHNLLVFGRYIELHTSTLLGYARTLTPSSDAEDLLGKAWMTVCNALDKHPLLLIENLDAWF